MAELEKAARNYLLNEHISPINDILHKCDLKVEMQYHTDIENAFKAGANWQYEQFEKEMLKHCDKLTAEQVQTERDFVVQHLKKYNSTPTYSDAIEYGRKIAFDKAVEWLEDELCAEKVNTLYPPMSIVVSRSYESVDEFIQGFKKIN